jgi:hypothetical protein
LRITVDILPRIHVGRSRTPPAGVVDGPVSDNYLRGMSTHELMTAAITLPLPDRVSLAQALWESIEAGLADTDEDSAVREAIRRDEEVSSDAIGIRKDSSEN